MVKQHYLILNGEKYKKLRKSSTYVIGRSRKASDIAIRDDSLSRQHAKLIVGENSITIQDLNSTNGTKVGDKQIKNNQLLLLRKGMKIHLGEYEGVLEIDFDEVDSDYEEESEKSRSRSKEIRNKNQNEEKKQKIWMMGNLKKDERNRLKNLMGAKNISDDEEEDKQKQQEFDKINKTLEHQYKVAMNHKNKQQRGLGL